ncbi:MAG: HEAT repeat domain-containing protein [Planctomycetes bacterium]|nr:HEAT repeat domain-containing protein [Planctomycetota bacterium]
MAPRRTAIASLFVSMAWSWTAAGAVRAMVGEEVPPGLAPAANLSTQLENCRAGLLDPQARPGERQRWAEVLLAFDAPPARSQVVEILGRGDAPAAQRSLCDAIADRATRETAHLHPELVEPLVKLLGAESEELRVSASRALSVFGGSEVPARLRTLAARADAPLATRLAAIDALAPQVDRREVVGELIALLETGVPAITDRVVAALEPACRDKFGPRAELWRAWWAEKSRLPSEAWLAEQFSIYRDRLRKVEQERAALREENKRRIELLTQRLGDFQRELFRTVSAEQQDARLLAWLEDAAPEVKLTALGIVQARIADEGRRPAGELLAALLQRLKDPSATVRREALLIVQTLNDAAAVKAVLAMLDGEKDTAMRQAALKAVGKLEHPEAIPVLLREITAAETDGPCVREAALALGQVVTKLEDPQRKREIVTALQERYRRAGIDETALRAALLSAMAGAADPSFALEFVDAVESNDAAVLRAAIRGLRTIGDVSKLPRLRALMADADPLVRLAATEAVAKLGTEETDLESLLARLSPATEANDLVREAAWRGFREFVGRKPLEERLQQARRLRESPDLEIRFLEELAAGITPASETDTTPALVHERLATALSAQGRYAEAAAQWRRLFELSLKQPVGNADQAARRWLDAALHAATEVDVASVVSQIAASLPAEAVGAVLVETVGRWFDSAEMSADAPRARALLAVLKAVTADGLPSAWGELLARLETQLGNPDSGAAAGAP